MGKGPTNGGIIANRGFIFQAIVAEIQCLERNDWNSIKVEPETKLDKVDIMLYQDEKILSAIQVKSSKNPFERSDVKKWIEKLRADATEAEEICLYLVGEPCKPACEDFIAEHSSEIKKISFERLPIVCVEKLVEYIRSAGVDEEVRVDDLEFLEDALFAKLFKNSIAKEPISRTAFEERFQKALPVYIIPKCLTPIPTINHEVGLVGRDDIKKSVREMLETNDRTALVSGLGGIGKTAVMQHICNDLKNEGNYVAWIECGESFKEDLLLLRTALGIPESDNAEVAYEKIIKELRTNKQLAKKLYIFLDNLSHILGDDEQEELNGLGIHVMVTSRFKHDYFVNLPLDALAEQSALDMFYGYYLEKQKDKTRRYEDAALDIIRSVQCHTLLTELLAKAAWKKGGTLEAFRDALKAEGVFDVFQRKLRTKHDKNRTIEECAMKLYETSNLSPAQQHIMKLFTIFRPEKEIYYEIGQWAELDMDAMDELVDLGWLERGGLESGYQIHQIIKDSITRQMEKYGESIILEDYGDFLNNVIKTDKYIGKDVAYDKVRERIVLTEDVAKFFDESRREDIAAGKLYNNMAMVYFGQGDCDKALEYFGKALAIAESVFGKEHPNTGVIYNNTAGAYNEQGNYEKALEFFGKALAINERVSGSEHPNTAATYNNMAMVYRAQGDAKKALEYFEKALAVNESMLWIGCHNTAATNSNMAAVYQAKGDYERARECLELERVLNKIALGMEHPNTASTYDNTIGAYREQVNYEQAQKYLENALTINENELGTIDPHTATMYNNMAVVYHAQGDDEKALEYFEKALSVNRFLFITGYQYTAAAYNNIATVYHDQSDYEKALEYFGKALAINERILGTEHPNMASTYNNMAMVYTKQGNYEKALEYYGKALAIDERVLGTEHPNTAAVYSNMAMVYQAQGNYEKAMDYYSKSLVIRECLKGTVHSKMAALYNDMAEVCQEQGDYEKALEYYGKALALNVQREGEENPNTAAMYNNMARVYEAQEDYEKALEHYGKAAAISEIVFGTEHPGTATIYNNIGGVYDAQCDYEKALEYYRKANAVFLSIFGEKHPYTQDTNLKVNLMELLLMTGMTEDALLEILMNDSTSKE